MQDRAGFAEFVRSLPKAELHVHIEGTLEPDLMLALAERNHQPLPYPDVSAARAAYRFADLQSFLDLYYRGANVLQTEQDFYDLTWAYVTRAAQEGIRHIEPFFDPQTHVQRGVPFGLVIAGILHALGDAEEDFGITSKLIMCFLRDLSVEDAEHTLATAHLYQSRIAGVGLDSAEIGNPPEKFEKVFDQAGAYGLHRVAHAGEEGPASYITGALDVLNVERIDHGVRCLDDPVLVQRLVDERIPLTVCPLSNVKLRVFESLASHPLRRMMDAGLLVTVNSDDPAYFGGYLSDNYLAVAEALDLSPLDMVTLARNSFEASFADEKRKATCLAEIDAFLATR
ncbi:MAG: adenosine deaminase [Actinomycetota bacterium]|nr:adenosine deaminase [Actinomycetota bacterium]